MVMPHKLEHPAEEAEAYEADPLCPEKEEG